MSSKKLNLYRIELILFTVLIANYIIWSRLKIDQELL